MNQAADFPFGIEEEFFLVNPGTRNAATRVPERVLKHARAKLGDVVTRELFQSQIEISSPILHSAVEAEEVMRRLRRDLAEVSAAFGLRLVSAGTHPLASWHDQVVSTSQRHDQLVDDFQMVGRRNLLCGLHVHVAVPDGHDRIDIMNRAMVWLPLMLSLSTSSPFWNRQRTGLLSYRQAAYDEWPRTGIPDFFQNEADYDAFTALLVARGIVKDPSYLWWTIRPSAHFPTVELRIADACTHLEDTLAVAALFRCLVATLVRQPDFGRDRTSMTRFLIDENRWRAKRHGTDAIFVDEFASQPQAAHVVLGRLLQAVAPEAERLGCAQTLRHLDVILERGTSAHAQLAIYDECRKTGRSRLESLRAVVDWLIAATVPPTQTAIAKP